MVNALEPYDLFDVKPLGRGAQMTQRTAHCMFDLGNLRILNCIYPRVMSFRGVVLRFLRCILFCQTCG